jgi:predicted ATP-grasp superfamily ATP-dependent carboligase
MLENHSDSNLLLVLGGTCDVRLGVPLSMDLSGELFFIIFILVYLVFKTYGESPPFYAIEADLT